MPLGFLKSGRASSRPPVDDRGSTPEKRPDRALVLGQVEELGIGMFWATDAAGNLSFLSQRALVDLGADTGALIGKPLTAVFCDVDEETGGTTQRSLAFKLKARSRLEEQIVAVPTGRGSTRWWRLNGRPLLDAQGKFHGYRGSAVDISSQYVYETQVARQSQVDELTGLARFAEGLGLFRPSGPPRHRAERITIFRKVGLIHEDHYYDVILRNLSKTGARITGLAGVPVGTDVVLDLGHGQLVVSKVVNASENSQGLMFETSLISDGGSGFMTRHRISPYSLAEAGIPLAALGAGAFPLAKWREANKTIPKFVQLEMSAPGA